MNTDIKYALAKLERTITRMDVNASIADEDVKLWNDVINASKELKKVIEND